MRTSRLLVLILLSVSCFAEDEPSNRVFETEVQPFLQKYCLDCHSGDDPEAGYSFEFEGVPKVADKFDQWTLVLQKVGGHEMPPEDAEQPTESARAAFVKWIDVGLGEFDCAQVEVKPRTTLRRLNRVEYDNVIKDLFGLPIQAGQEFPADDVGEGFDNLGEVLSLPPLLMEKYVEAAETITAALKSDADAWQRVFPNLSIEEVKTSDVSTNLRQLASKAFRRPVSDAELQRLMTLYQAAKEYGADAKSSVSFAIQGILVSPQFLFRIEEDTTTPDSKMLLDDYALASRLSFFLWSTIPDDELNELAAKNRLNDPVVLKEQVRRMLRHDKSRALVDNFAGQWLELRLITSLAPDPDLFPTFDNALRQAMIAETKEYFGDLIRNDGRILELLDSDYTFLNARLAKHYGIQGVDGDKLQRVKLQNDRRGGILTHASILTLTSNPTRTSPVKRGKWILDNILGTPPPPPPPNVPELEEGNDLLGSLRERMQQHRENPSCSVCHRKMDALGFGFENFDAIGAWRDRDGRYEIDASGELPGNIAFASPAELRKILISNSREFTGCLTRKLLIYALGRALSSRDQCLVDDIIEHVEQREHRFSELILAIVTSDAFRFSGDSGVEK